MTTQRKVIYATPELALAAADAMLERVYAIAEDLKDHVGFIPTHRARRAGRRICNMIDQVDEALGLDGEE